MTIQKKTRKRIAVAAIVLSALLLVLLVIIPFVAGIVIYNSVFGVRYETVECLKFSLEDFDGLQADRHEFLSDKGQKLVGYRYYRERDAAKGVVVLSHGFGGGGQNRYMDVAYYFVQSGYDVFAYDATGNDESEGEGTNGLSQGVADLDYAIDYLQEIEECRDLSVMLWGHSWGAYSASAVLEYHPEVKAIAAVAGFNRSSDLVKITGKQMVGGLIYLMMPSAGLAEWIKCGEYVSATALEGFAASDCGVFVAHSGDDDTVPIAYGYDMYYREYADDPRFQFVRYEEKGHSDILYSEEYIAYIQSFEEEFALYVEENSFSQEIRAAYLEEHLDREIYCNGLSAELFDGIVAFYDSYL